MLTTKDVKIAMRKPWWTLIKNEVARVIAIRIKAEDPGLRPHGSILGQAFVDEMNELPELRDYFHYLTTRGWAEILSDVEGDLSPEMVKVLGHEQGAAWFLEFQKFMLMAWKNSTSQGAEGPLDVFESFDRKVLEDIRKEWLLHLEKGVGPGPLALVMLEWMRDSQNDVLRRSSAAAFAFMAVRSWPEVLEAVERRLGGDLKTLDTPKAAEFFDEFKAMVAFSVREYWNDALGRGAAKPPRQVEDKL